MKKEDLIDLIESIPVDTLRYPWAKQAPPPKEEKHKGGLLENWWVIYGEDETIVQVCGTISGDDRFRDDTTLRTSYVVSLEYSEDSKTGELETRNTVYTLGERLLKEHFE